MKITKSKLKKIKKKIKKRSYESGFIDANVCYCQGYEKCKNDVKDALFIIFADQDDQDQDD